MAASAPAIVGAWQGAISAGGGSMRVVLHVSEGNEGKLTATLDSPDRGAPGIPITTITINAASPNAPYSTGIQRLM
jgi:hypothetical protein